MQKPYDKDKHIEMLQAVNTVLASKIVALNRRKMARNDEATNSWRRKAFYWKSLVDKLKGGN